MTSETRDYSHEARLHESPMVRAMYLTVGTAFVVLAVFGVFLPLLPTTPFLLLAAACYARGSVRFYNWLLNNRTFGPLIREWREYRSIPYRVKIIAIVLLVVTISYAAFTVFENPYARLTLLLIGLGHVVFLMRIPSRDASRA